jgi:CTP:molybdopterin cytidylyltransferase MocA
MSEVVNKILSKALTRASVIRGMRPEHTVTQDVSSTGVVLAAGAGTRYGMPKVCAHGGAWLRAAVAALHDGGCGEVVVVLGAAVVDVPRPARAVVADDWSVGLSASVRAGIRAADGASDFAVLTTVDTPDVDAATVRRVLGAAQTSPSGLARARYDGRPGHPVVIGRRHWPDLLDVLSGDDGAGPFLRGRNDVVAVECADLATGGDIDLL